MKTTKFDRGSIFVSTKNGNIYILVRESRPQSNGKCCYNLMNMEDGKMRFTEAHRAHWDSEPVDLATLENRFDLGLFFVGMAADFVPVIREKAESILNQPSPRELALAALASR